MRHQIVLVIFSFLTAGVQTLMASMVSSYLGQPLTFFEVLMLFQVSLLGYLAAGILLSIAGREKT